MFDVTKINKDDPCYGIVVTTMFGVRASYHTTLGASPMQLVFGREAILIVKNITNWENIRQKNKRVLIKTTYAKIAIA